MIHKVKWKKFPGMDVIIESPKSRIQLSYSDFNRMRCDIAFIVDRELGKYYKEDQDAMKLYGNRLDDIVDRCMEKYNNKVDKVFNFLSADKAKGVLSYTGCKDLLMILEDEQNKHATDTFSNTEYGSIPVMNQVVTGADFIRLINECVQNCCKLKWK